MIKQLLNRNKGLFLLGVLALLFGAKASAQEWTYTSDYILNGETVTYYRDVWQKQDGGVIAAGRESSVNHHFWPLLTHLSPNGTELEKRVFDRPAFSGLCPHVFFDKEGNTFALMSYHPDYDDSTPNFFLNFDNPPDYATLNLYKLDDELNILESHEHRFQVDTAVCPHQSCTPNGFSGRLTILTAESDGNDIVGLYVKSPTFDVHNPRGQDTLFFFRMDFYGNFISRVGYEMESTGGGMDTNWLYYQLCRAGNGFVFYYNDAPDIYYTTPDGKDRVGTPGTAFFIDKDFQILDVKAFRQQADINPIIGDMFQQMSVVRSPHNSAYVTSLYCKPQGSGQQGIALYEFGDPERAGTLPMIRYTERSSGRQTWDKVALLKGVDIAQDNTIFLGYVLHPDYYILCIDRLTPDFDTIRTWRLGEEENYAITLYTIKSTEDNGILVVYTYNLYGQNFYHNTIAKISAEDFMAVKEDETTPLFTLLPNPTTGLINITGKDLEQAEVINALGQRVVTATGEGETLQADISELPTGVYFVNITDKEGRKCVRKIVKE